MWPVILPVQAVTEDIFYFVCYFALVLWQVFRGVARCCLPRFQGQQQHLKYQNQIKKSEAAVQCELFLTAPNRNILT